MQIQKLIFMCLFVIVSSSLAELESDYSETTTQVFEEKNKTLSDLVKEQTEAIKKILAQHKNFQVTTEPTTTRDPLIVKQENERKSIEELKLKCSGLFSTSSEKPKTEQPFGPPLKPDFLKPNRVHKPHGYLIFSPQNYGYQNKEIERHDEDKLETASSDVSEDYNDEYPGDKVSTKLKYVKLEPLILQKTMLTNGKSLFYWYKPMRNTQSFIQIPDVPENEGVESVAQPETLEHPIPAKYPYVVDPATGNLLRNKITKNAGPQFFVNPQNGMIYQYTAPNQLIYHEKESEVAATTTTTTTTTTEKPITPEFTVEYPETKPESQENDEKSTEKYRNELRFILPIVMPQPTEVSKYPDQFDPYAYFPSHLQPDRMNIGVPYVPNYQMIRTLAIPQKQQN